MPTETFSVHALFRRRLAGLSAQELQPFDSVESAAEMWIAATSNLLASAAATTGPQADRIADEAVSAILTQLSILEQRNDPTYR